jgi:hypothetical protein
VTSARFAPLRELDTLFQRIPGARTETRYVPDVLDREVVALLDAHSTRSPAAAALLRIANWKLGQHSANDDAIFATELTLDAARRAIARFHRFPAWSDVLLQAHVTVDPRFEAAADAIVAGDEAALRALLARGPELARALAVRAPRDVAASRGRQRRRGEPSMAVAAQRGADRRDAWSLMSR